MLSERLEWRRAFLEYEREFPQLGDEIQIVIDAVTPEAAEEAQRKLARRLRRRSDLFESIFVPGGGAFYEQNGLLYFEAEQLDALHDRVADHRDELLRLERDPTLRGLADVVEQALRESDSPNRAVRQLLTPLAAAVQAQLQRQPFQVSWREELEGRPATRADRRRFLIVRPRLDYAQSMPASPALNEIRKLAGSLTGRRASGVRVRLTGSEAIEHEALESVMVDMARAALAAILAVTLILYFGLRSFRLLVASLLTLVSGLAVTAAFAAAAIGSLNLISIAFAILYIGLGIDYTVHLSLAYAEARSERSDHATAIRQATERVGGALLLSALTTAACFYAFLPTDFTGVSELGLIGGTGMSISLFFTLTLLPALLTLGPLQIGSEGRLSRGSAPRASPLSRIAQRTVDGRRHWIIGVTVVSTIGALALIPRVRFDQNPINLSDPGSESITTYRELVRDPNTVPLAVSTLAESREGAGRLISQLEELPQVGSVLTVDAFVPEDQPQKLTTVESIAQLLGLPAERRAVSPEPQEQVSTAVGAVQRIRNDLRLYADRLDERDETARRRLSTLLKRWDRWLEDWPAETQVRLVEELEQSFLGTFASSMEALRRSLTARRFGPDDLPEDLQRRWIGRDGAVRVQVVPTEKLDSSEKLADFVSSVRSAAPSITGIPVNDLESSRVAVRSFRQAFTLALIAIAVMLSMLLRNLARVSFVLIPLVAASVLTFGASVVLKVPMNFANIITLPLLLGIGVDNGIHVLHRSRAIRKPAGSLFATSTVRAVVVSTLTTLASFGSLVLSSHNGLASMGRLLFIGMLVLLACTLLFLPALLGRSSSARSPAT
jgi:hopanoid biosynthesis associated RND transporter like protein HpnN